MPDSLLLPQEIWYQILTKVPAKSILQCRCVSKAWYSLISSSNFISDHTAQTLKHSSRSRVLVHTCDTNTGKCRFSSHDESSLESSHEHDDVPQRLEIIGCCAGLFCLSGYESTTGIDGSVNQVQRFLFWNPSIRKLVELPFSSSCSSEEVRYLLGFGFDYNGNDFKVLRVVYRQSGDLVPAVCEVFDMRKGVWRRLSPPATPSPFHYGKRLEVEHYHSCADLNGTLHWMANEYSSDCFLLSFNLSSEVFRVMETPDGIEFKDDDDFTKVLSINGLLSVALLTKQQQGDCFSVWSMKEYGNSESWTKLFHIELGSSLSLSTVFGFREKGEVLILPLWESDNDFEDLVLYNLKSRKYEALLSTNGFICSVWLYVESLVLL